MVCRMYDKQLKSSKAQLLILPFYYNINDSEHVSRMCACYQAQVNEDESVTIIFSLISIQPNSVNHK